MKTVSLCPWQTSVIVITVMVTLLIIFVAGYLVYRTMHTDNLTIKIIYIALTCLLLLTLLASVCMSPRKVEVCEKGVRVRLMVGRVDVASDDIVSITHYSCGIDAQRIVGCGKFFGNLGLFSSEVCGRYFSLVTNPGDVCVITRKTKMPVVVSVEDAKVFAPVCEITEIK